MLDEILPYIRRKLKKSKVILTADGLALSEDLGDLRVHVDHEVLLGLDLVVALLHLRLDPLGERWSDDRVDHVGDVLPRQLLHLLLDGEVLVDARVLVGERLHVLDGEALELGHADVLHVGTLDALLRAGLDVTEVPDGDILEGREEDVHLGGEEPVDFSLGLELSREFGGGHLSVRWEDLGVTSP